MASPDYGPAGKPSQGRMVQWTAMDGQTFAMTIQEANVDDGLIVGTYVDFMDVDHTGKVPTYMSEDVPFDAKGKPGTWRWFPKV